MQNSPGGTRVHECQVKEPAMFKINSLSPVRQFVRSLRLAVATERTAANLVARMADALERATAPESIRAAAEAVAKDFAPFDTLGAHPETVRADRLEVLLRDAVHGDRPEAEPAPACKPSKSARRRAKAKAKALAAYERTAKISPFASWPS